MGELLSSVVNGAKSLLGLKKAPTASTAPEETVDEAQQSASEGRAALYGTEGQSAGEQLTPDEIKKRDTLFGN